jgi:hypothetical protein
MLHKLAGGPNRRFSIPCTGTPSEVLYAVYSDWQRSNRAALSAIIQDGVIFGWADPLEDARLSDSEFSNRLLSLRMKLISLYGHCVGNQQFGYAQPTDPPVLTISVSPHPQEDVIEFVRTLAESGAEAEVCHLSRAIHDNGQVFTVSYRALRISFQSTAAHQALIEVATAVIRHYHLKEFWVEFAGEIELWEATEEVITNH